MIGHSEQTSGPAVEPLTLAEAQAQCRVVDAAEDAYLAGLIKRARRYIEPRIQRQLITATWALYLSEFPDEIELRRLPVSSVTSVAYVDLNGDAQTFSSASYQTLINDPDRPGLIKPTYLTSWPDVRSDTYKAVTVTYVAGYGSAATDVPESIRHAIALLVEHWYESREPITDRPVNVVPYSVDALLALDGWGHYA